jgi:hypothetical protein
MSEIKRQKKDGHNRDKQAARMSEGTVNPKQGVPTKGVHKDKDGPNPYDEDLKKANKGKDPRSDR